MMQEQQQAHDQDDYEQLQPQYEPLAPRQADAPKHHHQPGTMPQSGPQQQPYPHQQYPQHQYPQQQYPQQQYPQQQYPVQQQYPTQVMVQTGPNNGGACGQPYEKYNTKQSFALGLIQLFIGILCIIFNIIGIIFTINPEFYFGYYLTDFSFYTGYGMWPSIFFILAGGFGIGARSKNPCPVIAFMVMSIFAAIFTTFVIGYSSTGIAIIVAIDENFLLSKYLAMHCLLLILGVVEFVVAIWSSAICCAGACCGRNNNGNVHPVVQYGGQAGLQQVYIHTQGQQQTFNAQPQPGGNAYPAAGPGLAH